VYNEQLHDLCGHFSSNKNITLIKQRRITRAFYIAALGDVINAHKRLVGIPKGKTLLGKLRCRWKNINIHLKINRMSEFKVELRVQDRHELLLTGQ